MDKKNNVLLLNGDWSYYLVDSNGELSIQEIIKLFYSNKLKQMFIPTNWYLSEIGDYSGSIWFIKEFEHLYSKDSIIVLEFNGVDYFCEVYLNETFLGEHEGYFQRFYFDVSDKIKVGKNLLLLKVTSEKEETNYTWPNHKKLIKGIFNHHDCRPGGWDLVHGQDRNTGGIWNDVKIIYGQSIYISNFKIFTSLAENRKKAIINFELSYLLKKNFTKSKFKYLIRSEEGFNLEAEFSIVSHSQNKINLIVPIENPDLWYPYELGNSCLYEFLILENDTTIFNSSFGIREIKFKDEILYINGERFFLRGTNIIPEQMLAKLTQEKINFIIDLLKEANINIVRVHAHVNRQELYDAFDKAGILVWQDFALQWMYDESNEFISKAIKQIKDMVNQLHHHPAILFWCCHNEPGNQIDTLDNFLYEAVLNEDNSRIVRKASNYEEHCYEGWYWGKKENYIATPMGPLVTEFGAQALPEYDSIIKIIPKGFLNQPQNEEWSYHNFQYEQTFHIAKIRKGDTIKDFIEDSQTYQFQLLKEAIHHYRRKKFQGINGIFQFMFIDCWESISWSVIDYFGKKKKGFYALKEAFSPLLLSVNLRQKVYSNLSKKLNIEFWIINDFHQQFEDFVVKFLWDERELYSMEIEKIESDSVKHFPAETLNIKLPDFVNLGYHMLKVELRNNLNKMISSDLIEVEYENV